MNIEKLISLLCDEVELKDGYKLHRGSILNVNIYGDISDLEKLLTKIGGFEDLAGESYINSTFKNDTELVTVGYCEGDIFITQHDNKESYNKRVLETIEFYNNL